MTKLSTAFDLKSVAMGAAIALALPLAAAAAPTQWNAGVGANGHYYEWVYAPQTSWEADNPLAAGMTYAGLQGYLATITSAEEDAFVHGVAGGQLSWISGSDDASQGTTEGVWIWTGGPEAGMNFWNGLAGGSAPVGVYTNWNGGEPNNYLGAENYLQINWQGSAGWNDAGPSTYYTTLANGYVVEYGGLRAGVPEPASWALMIMGFGGIGAAIRNRRRILALTA